LEEYLRYRDSALELLQDSFCATALETGRILARGLIRENEPQLKALAAQFAHAPNALPLIGQAAVLGARGNPGVVRATMRGPDLLLITIERCPECRNLKRDSAFCFLNQGLMTELAESYLRVQIETKESKCTATGSKACEIHVTLAGT
jgi:predicted ArsR family transcriptional regulator